MLVNVARLTTLRGEVWRHCEICDELTAMPPQGTICDACATVATPTYGLHLVRGGGCGD